LLLNGADDRYKELHTNTISAVNENLLFKPLVEGDPDILMVGNKIQSTPGFFQEDNEMSHLSCFIGGMYALGGKIFGRPEDVETGAKLTDGCVWAYNITRSGVMPENFHVRRCPEGDEKCHFDFETVDADYKAREAVELKKLAAKGVNIKIYSPSTYSMAPNVEEISDGRGGTRWPVNGYYDMPRSFLRMDAKYIMRPEALESVFYLYRITGDPAWQEKGWRMFESIINLTAIPDPAGGDNAAPLGYSGVQDVSDNRGTKGNFRNEAESFWMAETLKYAYLLFSDPNVIALDDWVLNTEAHPLKRTIEKQ
jgi:mannosyl-oligosaccharide alpha-1,2-mannosidase